MKDKEYIAAITKQYKKSIRIILDKIAYNFASTLPEATYQEVVDKVLYIMYRNWKGDYIDKIAPTVDKWTQHLYRRYRSDKGVLGAMVKPPKVNYSLSDFRAMAYFKDSDNFYLGRFITDQSTTKKITQYIKKEYLEQGGEIGRSPEMIQKFKDNFGDVLDGEDWKIRRVIDTTVSRMRTTGAVHYMVQAGVEEYEVVEAMDSLTCGYCSEMNGKTFSISRTYERVENLDFGDGSGMRNEFPFATSVFKNPEDMQGMTPLELQQAGLDMPPYHPACRGTIVASI